MRSYPRFGTECEVNPVIMPQKTSSVTPEIVEVESPHVSPIKKSEHDLDMVWMQTPNDLLHVLTELTNEVSPDLPTFEEQEKEKRLVEEPNVLPPFSEFALWLNDEAVETSCVPQFTPLAMASGKFPMNEKQMRKVSESLHQRIHFIESEMTRPKESPFVMESTNIQGDFEKELLQVTAPPEIKSILLKFRDVFGPLPPPGKGCKLVEMDLELKDEWKDSPLRQKCWPMCEKDCQEIEMQVNELVTAGWWNHSPPGNFRSTVHPLFW